MNPLSRKIQWLVWGGLGVVILIIVGAFVASRLNPGAKLPVYGQVSDFALTNQYNEAVTLRELKGKVWVADIIFTRCPGPCAQMTRQMRGLQEILPKSDKLRLVSLTTDPEFDTPAVLKKYAGKFGAEEGWLFLTGTKQQIANLAIDSLKLTTLEKEERERTSPEDLFIHSTIFVLVDKQGRLRGIYDTTGEDIEPEKVREKIAADVKTLIRERP